MADDRGPVAEDSLQSQTRLTASNRAELLAGYAAGAPVRELATRFGVHRATVSKLVRRAGLEHHRSGLPDQVREEAAHLYSEGLTPVQIADRLAISYDGARAAVVACGGTLRPRGRRPARV